MCRSCLQHGSVVSVWCELRSFVGEIIMVKVYQMPSETSEVPQASQGDEPLSMEDLETTIKRLRLSILECLDGGELSRRSVCALPPLTKSICKN